MAVSSTSNVFDALQLQDSYRQSVANTMLSAGTTLYQKKKYAEAAKAFRGASALNPNLAQAYTYLGYSYTQLGKKQDAISALKLSLKVDKTQDQVYSDLANLYIDTNKNTDAETTLKAAIKQNNLNTTAYYTLGQLQSQRKDYKDAETNFRKVIQIEPKNANGYYALGMALNGQGRYNDAITQLNKATKLKQNFAAAIGELGNAYVGLNNTTKVQEQIDKLNAINTSTSNLTADNLAKEIKKPEFYYYKSATAPLKMSSGTMNVSDFDWTVTTNADGTTSTTQNTTSLDNAGESKQFSITIAFDSAMDTSSVQNIVNWQMSKARGGTAGLYNNGLYSAKEVNIQTVPDRVSYDATTREATIFFTVRQNSTGDGVIDPKHIVFKFLGTDANGKSMDTSVDQFSVFSKFF